jgi:hypothetical protein
MSNLKKKNSISESNDNTINSYLKTKREKKVVNFFFQDFSRIHTQFSDKSKSIFIETPVYSMTENEAIKYKFRFYPSKHSLSFDAINVSTDPSAQLFIDVFLLDKTGRKFNPGHGRKVECHLNNQIKDSVGHFVYDREDLEKKREILFNADKLCIQIEIISTYIDISDTPSEIKVITKQSTLNTDENDEDKLE